MSGSGEPPKQFSPERKRTYFSHPRAAALESGYSTVRDPGCARFHSNQVVRNLLRDKIYRLLEIPASQLPYAVLYSNPKVSGDLQLTYDPSIVHPYNIVGNPESTPSFFWGQVKKFLEGDEYYQKAIKDNVAPAPYMTPPTPILGTFRLVWYIKDGAAVGKDVEGAEKVAHVIAYMLQPGKPPEPAAAGGVPPTPRPILWLLEQYDTNVWIPGDGWAIALAAEMGALEVRRPVVERGRGFDLQKEGGDESKETCVSWALVILAWLAEETKKGLNLRTAGTEEFRRMYEALQENPEQAKSLIFGAGRKRRKTRGKRRGRRLTRRR